MPHDDGALPDPQLELIIVTPRGEAFSGPVEGVVLPGAEGEFGVLQSHEAFLTALRGGEVEIQQEDGGVTRMTVSDGFARVANDRVVVLVGECRAAGDGEPDATEW